MISQIGDRFTQMAFIELLGVEFFGSFAAFGGVAVIFTLPSIVLGPIAGPMLDSWRKKRVLLVSDAVRALLIVSLPFVYFLSGHLIFMLGVAFVVYIFGFFFSSARLAIVPLIVDKKELMQANSANLTLLRAATGIGTFAGGFLVAWIGWRLGFVIDAITYVISFVLILFIKVDEKPIILHAADTVVETGKKVSGYLKEIKEGIRLMTQTRMMRFVMLSIVALFFVSGVAFTVIVPTVQQTLSMGTIGVTLLAAAAAGGMFLGPLLTGIIGPAFRKDRLIIVSYILTGLLFAIGGGSYLLVGLERVISDATLNLIMAVIMGLVVFVAGILFSAINISQDTIIQERIPARARGRLFAWRETLASLAFLVTAVPAGFIAEKVEFTYVLLATGGILVLFALVWIGILWRGNESETLSINGGKL
ncbi:putative bacilysin exporter BacE [subsurface metagenome]